MVKSHSGFVYGLFISSVISNPDHPQSGPREIQKQTQGFRLTKGILTHMLQLSCPYMYQRQISNASYKDIEDKKFEQVIKYIEFLKNNPS